MGLFNFIPYVGAWLGLAAPVIFLLTLHLEFKGLPDIGNMYFIAIIIVIIIHLIEQGLEMSIIQPNVIGKQVHIHPLAVLASLIFFGGVFGFVGVLLAVPLAGTIRAFIEYFGEQVQTSNTLPTAEVPVSSSDIKITKRKKTKK